MQSFYVLNRVGEILRGFHSWYYHLVDPVVICRAIHCKLVQMKTEGTTHIYGAY